MMAAELRADPEEIGFYRLRPPVKPISLSELATLPAAPELSASIMNSPMGHTTPEKSE